jgi:multidrug efflux pump subunit AcrA (membrane-fusion protein)
VVTTAKQSLDFVPQVRVAAVRPSAGTEIVNLPATTSAFSVANVFARASGYIDKREVDIGDRVKAGQLLAEIVAPELYHQSPRPRRRSANSRPPCSRRRQTANSRK